jgi:hypothetical protein
MQLQYILTSIDVDSIARLIIFSGVIPTIAIGSTAGWYSESKRKIFIGRIVFIILALMSFLLGLNGYIHSKYWYEITASIVFMIVFPIIIVIILILNRKQKTIV